MIAAPEVIAWPGASLCSGHSRRVACGCAPVADPIFALGKIPLDIKRSRIQDSGANEGLVAWRGESPPPFAFFVVILPAIIRAVLTPAPPSSSRYNSDADHPFNP